MLPLYSLDMLSDLIISLKPVNQLMSLSPRFFHISRGTSSGQPVSPLSIMLGIHAHEYYKKMYNFGHMQHASKI